jgi:hypothetical protein
MRHTGRRGSSNSGADEDIFEPTHQFSKESYHDDEHYHHEDDPFGWVPPFWIKVKDWSEEGRVTKNVLIKGLKITGLAVVGIPVAIMQGAVSLALKEAFDLLWNVGIGGTLGVFIPICKAILNTIALAWHKLPFLGNEDSAKENIHEIKWALAKMLGNAIGALSLGVLELKVGSKESEQAVRGRHGETRVLYDPEITGLGLRRGQHGYGPISSPIAHETAQIGREIKHQYQAFRTPKGEAKPERPEYQGEFKLLTSIVYRIGVEAGLVKGIRRDLDEGPHRDQSHGTQYV